MRAPRLLVIFAAAAFAACSGNASTSSSSSSSGGTTAGTAGGAGATTGSGTGSSGGNTTGSSGGNWQAFAGSWEISGNGALTFADDGGTDSASGAVPPSTYQITFSRGTSSDLVSLDSGGCQLPWSVSGDTATLQLPVTCTPTNPAIGNVAFAAASGTLSLTVVDANHLSGTANLDGTLTDYNQTPVQTSATVASAAGTLTRVGH